MPKKNKTDLARLCDVKDVEVIEGEVEEEVLALLEEEALGRHLAVAPAPVAGENEENPAAVYLASLAEGSRRTMRGALELVAREVSGGSSTIETLMWGALRFQHTQAIRSSLASRYAPATANKCVAALRGTLKAAWRLGQIPTEEYQRAIDVQAVRGSTLSRGRALSSGEMRALLQGCAGDNRPSGRRDVALLALLYNCGLRRAEAVALDVGDYNPESGEVKVRSGKGRKARAVFANGSTRGVLDAWIELRGRAQAGDEGPLFLPLTKSGRILNRRLNNQSVMDILLRRARSVGVLKVSPHDFRRTFISDLLDAGVDTITVQKMAGHASPTTTARYDRRGEAAKQKASEVLHVPV